MGTDISDFELVGCRCQDVRGVSQCSIPNNVTVWIGDMGHDPTFSRTWGGVHHRVIQRLMGGVGPSGTDSESLQGWIQKFGVYSKNICISVEYIVEWMVNQSPSWSSYHDFMSSLLIALDNLPGLRPVGVM